jgi:hypothetical protein
MLAPWPFIWPMIGSHLVGVCHRAILTQLVAGAAGLGQLDQRIGDPKPLFHGELEGLWRGTYFEVC